MEDTISNRCKRCKDCRWLKISWHDADFSRGGGMCTHPYRNYFHSVPIRIFSSTACKYFEERKDNKMDIEKTIKDCECKLYNVERTIDQLEEQLVEEPTISEESDTPINKYGIGQTLYLPVKVVGIRSKKTPNGGDIVLYELTTATDIWHDKDHYMVSIPEGYIRDHFKEVSSDESSN